MISISSLKHPAFVEAAALLKSSVREETRRYLIETENFVTQALASDASVFGVFALTSAAPALVEPCRQRGVPLYTLGMGLMQKLVGTGYETAVTAIAVVGQKRVELKTLESEEGLILAAETLQDPRNVGVLVRTAEAAGCAALLLSSDSAEAYSRAAVRSTTGSILRLPLCVTPDFPAALRQLKSRGAEIVATSVKAPALAYDTDLRRRPLVLCVGNETQGMSKAARAEASAFVSLPMAPGGASSLNVTVAAGVLLYEAVRQRRG